MTMKNCLLIENDEVQAETWRRILKKSGYETIHCLGTKEADKYLGTKNNVTLPDVVAVDLGLPPKGESFQVGAEYAVSLRARLENLPILAYTAQTGRLLEQDEWDYRTTIRFLLPWRISVIFTRNLPVAMRFQEAVNLTANQIVVISPHPANLLWEVLPSKPDPLNNEYWETLKNLSSSENMNEAAAKTKGVKRAGFIRRLEEIKKLLVEVGEFQSYDGIYKEDLIAWYRKNNVKYLRG